MIQIISILSNHSEYYTIKNKFLRALLQRQKLIIKQIVKIIMIRDSLIQY